MKRYIPVPFTETETNTEKGTTPTPLSRGKGSFRRLPPEMRALASEAYALWRDLARERSNPYGDHTGCLLAGRMAVDATLWEDGLVILEAIRQRMDEKSSPRWIAEWARTLGASKREEARNAQRRAEKEHISNLDPEVLRVMAEISRSKSKGKLVNLEDHICILCKQFTEGRCMMCQRPMHEKACRSRHSCEAVA